MFHHGIDCLPILHSLINHKAEAPRFTVPANKEAYNVAVAMTDRVVRHTRNMYLLYAVNV